MVIFHRFLYVYQAGYLMGTSSRCLSDMLEKRVRKPTHMTCLTCCWFGEPQRDQRPEVQTDLVGGFNQPLWKMQWVSNSWDDYSIPNWMESHKIPWFQTTNQWWSLCFVPTYFILFFHIKNGTIFIHQNGWWFIRYQSPWSSTTGQPDPKGMPFYPHDIPNYGGFLPFWGSQKR